MASIRSSSEKCTAASHWSKLAADRMDFPQPLVSVEWLNRHLEDVNVVILDASLPKPKSSPADNPLSIFKFLVLAFLTSIIHSQTPRVTSLT